MLDKDEYEILKSSFIESQRLFDKLNIVANNALNIDYDESGLYQDEVDTCNRHWLKLSSKIVDGLSDTLDGYSIELLKNDSLEARELTFNILKEQKSSKIHVDYSENGALSISQIS